MSSNDASRQKQPARRFHEQWIEHYHEMIRYRESAESPEERERFNRHAENAKLIAAKHLHRRNTFNH